MTFVLGIWLFSRGNLAWRVHQSNIPVTKENVIKIMMKSQEITAIT